MRRKTFLILLGVTFLTAGMAAQVPAANSAPTNPTQVPAQPAPASAALRLTVQDAEALALRNNPQVSVYRLLAMASQQVTREAKSNYYPNIYGSVTAVEPQPGSRIAAGALNNPIIYERVAAGVTLAQLITDFGRTNNLVATAALRAKASNLNAQATAAQIKLAADQAFFNALQANAELKV
ncbi:MAG TPA: TolC family protein, partial [Terriglobales bacterium]